MPTVWYSVCMTQFSKETVLNRINRSYSFAQLGGSIFFPVLLLAFTLTFPDAFEVIKYPPAIPMIIALISMLLFVLTYVVVKRIDTETDEGVRRIIAVDQHSTYYRNMVTLVLLPAFGEQYAHLFWFVAALSSATIFTSVFIPLRLKAVTIISPFLTFLIHYAYWNLPGLLRGGQGVVKPLQGVEIGFAVLMSVLFYLAFKELGESTQLAANFSFDDRIIDRYVSKNGLTEREKDILVKVLQGKSTKQIGEELFISAGTARNHLSNIYAKTGTHSRLELASQTYAAPPN